MLTIQKIWEETKHVNSQNLVQLSDPSNQESMNKRVEYIHALPQKWNELLNAALTTFKLMNSFYFTPLKTTSMNIIAYL